MAPDPVQERLVAAMRACLRVPEPSTNVVRRAAGESLFDGSYDWHSNLFAHWALLVHARRTGDAELAGWVLAPLTPEALEAERQRLAAVPIRRRAVYPYGEGFLLQLLAELEHHREVGEPVRAFRRELEGALLDWLEAQPMPEVGEERARGALEGRRFLGWYRSWAWNLYQLARTDPIRPDATARLDRLFADKFAPHAAAMLKETRSTPYEFLDVPAIAFLVHDVRPLAEAPTLPEIDTGLVLPEKVTLRDTHSLGKWISRLWPLAIAARTDAAKRALLDEELARYLAREDLWDGDFTVIRHWIPQFLWFTLWLAQPRD